MREYRSGAKKSDGKDELKQNRGLEQRAKSVCVVNKWFILGDFKTFSPFESTKTQIAINEEGQDRGKIGGRSVVMRERGQKLD